VLEDASQTSADDSMEEPPPDAGEEAVVESVQTAGSRRRYLAAFIVTVVVVGIVLGLLPSALVSMFRELRGQAIDSVYDLFTGAEVNIDQTFGPDTAFVNVTVTNLDESSRTATLTISGHRVCGAICPPTTGTFFSLGNEAAERRGLPPSAVVTVPGGIWNLHVYHSASHPWHTTTLSVRHLHAAFGMGRLGDFA
jgi:hypothetical protein